MQRRLIAFCLCLIASAPAGTLGSTFGASAATSSYVIEGLTLGEQFRAERDYQCKPSIQFTDVTWCLRRKPGRATRGSFMSSTSILQGPNGTIGYVNREVEPAFFGDDEMQNEITRLTAKFGERARVMRLPPRPGLPNAVIASWGAVELEQLDDDVVGTLAGEATPRLGLLVDYLNDVKRSAQLGLPIFRLGGGAGYLWSASSDDGGRGHLRFLIIDASILAPGKAAKPALAPPAPTAAPAAETEKPTGSLPPAANLATKAVKLQIERAPAEPPKEQRIAPKVAAPAAVAPEKDKARLAALESEASSQRGHSISGRAGHSPEAGSSARAALQSEAETFTVDAKERSWSLGERLMFALAALAVLALVLAMRLQRRDLEQRQLRAAGRKADLRARLGRTEVRDVPRHAAEALPLDGALPPDGATAPAIPTAFGTLRTYVSAAFFLTIAVSIYLGSQNPGAIKHFIAHLSHARVIAAP
jgi:hypothetical protein